MAVILYRKLCTIFTSMTTITMTSIRSTMNTDFSNWMSTLDEFVCSIPLCYLALPGSHDSLSYSVLPSYPIAPDAPRVARILNILFGSVGKRLIYKWSLTQKCDVEAQLRLGIRYFDVRVSARKKENLIRSCHGLYGIEISIPLKQMNKFLTSNSKEVVILDFQHIYLFDESYHKFLCNILYSTFGNKICPLPKRVTDVTLQFMWKNKYQVIVIYRDEYVYHSKLHLWPCNTLLTIWPNTTKICQLIKDLNSFLAQRPPDVGYVSQGVLTPHSKFMLKHFFSSLRKVCAKPCHDALMRDWIPFQTPGPQKGAINIIISDFIDINDGEFCELVIRLNDQLL